jgi:rRNA maturation protein Nop10
VKTHVYISFNSYDVPWGAQTVLAPAQCGSDVAKINDEPVGGALWVRLTLEDTDPRLHALLDRLRQYEVEWSENHYDVYTEADLDSAPLIVMRWLDEVMIRTGTPYGTTYDLTEACPACGTGAKQTSSTFIDAADLHSFEGWRAVATDDDHILVDSGLEADLVRTGATGMVFRDVYAVGPGDQSRKIPFRELCAKKTLAPVSPSTTGLRLYQHCEVCWRNGDTSGSLEPKRRVYRAVDLDGADDVNMSWENHGPARLAPEIKDSYFSRPSMLVTPKVYRVFRDAGVTCFHWTPVRVEEGPSITPEERRRYLIEHADTLVEPPLTFDDDDDDDEEPAESDEEPETPEPSDDGRTLGMVLRQLKMEREAQESLEAKHRERQDLHTEEELDRARLLLMELSWSRSIRGGFAFGTDYDLSSACPSCGSGARQTSALFVNGDDLHKVRDRRVGMALSRQGIVDRGIAKELELTGITGLCIGEMFVARARGGKDKLPWKYFSAARTLPPMSPATTGFTRKAGCDRCHRDGYFFEAQQPTRIVYREADLRDIDDVNLSWENLWQGVLTPSRKGCTLPAPLLLVTPKVRRIFRDAGVTCFDWIPVGVEEA